MALRHGQREVRIEENYVRAALKEQPHGDYINLDEEIVGASMVLRYDAPNIVVFLVEKREPSTDRSVTEKE